MTSTERPIESGAGPRGLQQAGYGQLGYTTPQFVNVNLSRWVQATFWSYATTFAVLFLTAVAILTTFNNYVDATRPDLVPSSLERSFDEVTATFETRHGLEIGSLITISGASPSSFNGTFEVTRVDNSTRISWEQFGEDVTDDSVNSTGSVLRIDRLVRAMDRWQTAEDVFNIIFWSSFAILVALIALVQVWSFKSHKATGWLWPRERKWSRGWSVGAWWIPLANFLLVPMVLTEVFKIASGARDGERTRNGWALGRSSSTVILWFVSAAIGISLFAYGSYLTNADSSTITDYRWGVALTLGGTVSLMASSIIAIAFVRNVSWKLAPRY